MRNLKNPIRLFMLLALLLGFTRPVAICQSSPVKWHFEVKQGASATEYDLIFTAKIDKGWHTFSQFQADGPVPTSFTFKAHDGYILVGKTEEVSKPKKIFDKAFGIEVTYYEKEAIFIQHITLNSELKTISGSLEYMCCDASKCMPPESIDFSFNMPPSGK